MKKVRLAGAVRPDDAAQFAVIDGEIDVAVGDQAAIALGQRAGLQDGAGAVCVRMAAPRHQSRRRRARDPGVDGLRLGIRADRWLVRRFGFRPVRSGRVAIEIDEAAHQTAAQKDDQQHENDSQHQLPGGAEMQRGLEEVAQIEPDGGADQRPEQRAGAADRGLHDELARGVEGEGVRRHEALHHSQKTAGKTGIGRGDDEGGELVAVNIVADGGGAQRVVADRAQDRADRRAHDTQRDHDADEIPEGQERIERQIRIELDGGEAEIHARRRHAGQPILAAGISRQRIEFDEIEHLRNRHRDHGEVDAGPSERDQPDQIADERRRDGADEHGHHDVRKTRDREQIGGDHAAGAEKGRLAERQQPGKAEQDVEAEAEQAPDQDAVDRGGREIEIGQHEGRGDQPDRRHRLDEMGVSPNHQMTALIRGRLCRAGRRDEAPARASSRRTA